MTAKEKFEQRLNQFDLADEWSAIGCIGKVATLDHNGNILLFIHEGSGDGYTEIHYPSYNSLRAYPEFVKACSKTFVTLDDDATFATKVGRWLLGVTDECPLDPVDIYAVVGEDYNEIYHEFEDDADEDKEEEEYQANIQKYSEFCGWALSTLSYIRSTLYDAVRMELGRGHNIPDAYDVANGQDYFFDFSFCHVDTQKVVATNGVLYVVCYENGGKTSFEIPFDSLSEEAVLDIYESMK